MVRIIMIDFLIERKHSFSCRYSIQNTKRSIECLLRTMYSVRVVPLKSGTLARAGRQGPRCSTGFYSSIGTCSFPPRCFMFHLTRELNGDVHLANKVRSSRSSLVDSRARHLDKCMA